MIESEIDEIAKTESMDNGKPLREAQADVDDAVHCFRYYAGAIFHTLIKNGKFQGVISAQTPTGSFTVYECILPKLLFTL